MKLTTQISDIKEEQCIQREEREESDLSIERRKMPWEEPVHISECQTMNVNKGEKTRHPEKRLRPDSAEYIDEDYFITVTRGHKRLARSFSKKSNNSIEKDLQGNE